MSEREKCKVEFLPDGIKVEVERGETILQAAQKAGVYVASVCGGEGVCGKCKVVVRSGEVDAKPTALLERGEIRSGYVLACQAEVLSDTVVEIPPQSRLEEGQIVLDEGTERFGLMGIELPSRFRFDPLVKKLYLEIPEATIENPLAVHERLYQAIWRKLSVPHMQTGYAVLRQLAAVVRESAGRVTVTLGQRANTTEVVQVEPGDTSSRNYGVAIDVGTTTIVVHLLDLNTGKTLGTTATYNSQMAYGEDYIRRITYAEQNNALDKLQHLVVSDINQLVSSVVAENRVRVNDVMAAICSGNTAMIHFLLGLDPTGIRREPYTATAYRVPPLRAGQVGIGINPRALLYTLPAVAAYVGSDITAGVLVVGLDEKEDLSLFIDVGTNGEVVVGNRDWLMACSASAGPAFEGSGVTCGMRAAGGAIERVRITARGEVKYSTIAGKPPRGICGSGLIDALAEMYRAGVLDRSGTIQPSSNGARVRQTEFGAEYILVPKSESATHEDIILTQSDIRNLLRSKAAIYASLSTLLHALHLSTSQIERVYIAGGFGNFLDVRNTITIGMLPDISVDRILFVGNTSVAGAKQCLLSSEALERVDEIGKKMTYVDLMTNPRFMEEFMSALFIPHTALERFPSVK